MRFTTGAIRVEPDRHHVTLPWLGMINRLESNVPKSLSGQPRRRQVTWSFGVPQSSPDMSAGEGRSVGVGELLRYATSDRSTARQTDALAAAGCERIWTDVASGARARRPGLNDLLATAVAGDTAVVTRLYRLGRSLPELLALVEDLSRRELVYARWVSRSTPRVPQADWCSTCLGPVPSSSTR